MVKGSRPDFYPYVSFFILKNGYSYEIFVLFNSEKLFLKGTHSVKLLSVEGLEFWNVEKIKAAFLSLYDLVFSLELKFRNINSFQFDTYF